MEWLMPAVLLAQVAEDVLAVENEVPSVASH